MKKTKEPFRKEIEKALIDKEKGKGWLAGQMGIKRGTFWAKMNNKPNYTPFTEEEKMEIRRIVTSK